MKSLPLVSIVLPTYNGSKYLASSIESCINQTYQNWELIIVDDASTDDTPSIIEQYLEKDQRIRSVRHSVNRKLPCALNTGFGAAQGEYFTWAEDDNLYHVDAIMEMTTFLENQPDVNFVYTDCTHIDDAGNPVALVIAAPPETLGLDDTVGACFLYRRIVHEKLGGYSEEFFLAEDLDFWIRVMISFKIQPLHRNLIFFRQHKESLTSSYSKIYLVKENVLNKHLSRMYWLSDETRAVILARMAKSALRQKDIKSFLKYMRKAAICSPVFFIQRAFLILIEKFFPQNGPVHPNS
jgi:glycosyltransferase involved in cell wall biosynthesis